MEYALLTCALAIVGSRRLRYAVIGLAVQSLLLGGWLVWDGAPGGLLTIAVKGLLIPGMLLGSLRALPARPKTGLTIQMRYCMVIALSIVVVMSWVLKGEATLEPLMPGVSIALLGVLILTTRTKSLSQVVGLMVVENGIAVASISLTGGLPGAVELGVLLDAGLMVLVATTFSRRMADENGSLDTTRMNELRG